MDFLPVVSFYASFLRLLEKQRLYFKTVKEFKEVRGGWGP